MTTASSLDTPATLRLPLSAWYVLLAGFSVRMYLYYQIPLINPDGFLYIQQAKALYFGLSDQLMSCYSYLSPYPMVVCMAYGLFGDWVTAAQSVNIFFGTLALIPFYWLLRRFFENGTAILTTLAFALLPAYALVSTDALRDPMFWFFGITGLYLFILHIEKRHPLLLLCCSLCLSVAAWARIEGILYILVSAAYLPFLKNRHKWTDLLIFLSPSLFSLAVILVIASVSGLNGFDMLNPKRILDLPLGVISQYESIRDELKTLYQPDMFSVSKYFFDRIRSLVWIIAFIALIVLIVETLLYVFFLFLVAGVVSRAHRIWTDTGLCYVAIICISAMVLLYFHTFCLWHAAARQLAVFLLPAFVFIGAGMEICQTYLTNRFRCKPATAVAILITVIMLTFVPKILRANYDRDKLIFTEIGRFIAHREAGERAVSVCGAFERVIDVHFYANVNTRWAPCFDDGALFHRTSTELLQLIRSQKYDYFIWDEKGWQNGGLDPAAVNSAFGFIKIREWQSRKIGKLILYEVTK